MLRTSKFNDGSENQKWGKSSSSRRREIQYISWNEFLMSSSIFGLLPYFAYRRDVAYVSYVWRLTMALLVSSLTRERFYAQYGFDPCVDQAHLTSPSRCFRKQSSIVYCS